jgi:hypothetical protein
MPLPNSRHHESAIDSEVAPIPRESDGGIRWILHRDDLTFLESEAFRKARFEQ